MVKQSWSIYKRDLKTIFTNYAVLITIIALCILPSLYAWINIKASWDPYSKQATSRIKVAVVNNDTGSVIGNEEIYAGQEVVDGLKKNTLLGWQFLDEKEAMQQLENGKIYAVIVIPKEFSQDLTSIITNHVQKAEIKYIVNEKLNAIAPKITDKGASGIKQTVSEEVISTVSSVVLGKAKELGIELEDVVLPKLVEAQDGLDTVIGKFDDINGFISETQGGLGQYEKFISNLIDYMPQLDTLIANSKDVTTSMQDFLGNTNNDVTNLAPTIKKDIGLVSDISSEIYSGLESLESFIESGSEKAPEVVENLLTKVDGIEALSSSLLKILQSISKLAPNNEGLTTTISNLKDMQNSIGNLKQVLQTIQDKLANGGEIDLSTLDQTKTVLGDVQSISSDLYNRFDSEILGKIEDIFGKVDTVLNNGDKILSDVQQSMPEIRSLLETAQNIMSQGESGLEKIQTIMPTLEQKVSELADKVAQINDSKDLRDILDLLKEDVTERVQFLANSTTIVDETIFPMGNYGSQMAPFYSALASWVGLTILVSILSVEVNGEYKPYEVYFGKLFTYLTIALIQGLIIALGDLYLLKIYCLRPWMFILSMLYIAVTFTFIVYSLVSVFGNIGKVVAIILLILQIAGSGGTFPVQLTTHFFITINPFLPFTYGVSLLRESIGGIARSILVQDLLILLCFIVGFLLLALLLKKSINKALSSFVDKYHEGGL